VLEGMASPFPFSSIDCFIGCFLSFFLFPVVGCFIGKDVFILLHEKDGKFWLFGCSGVLSCEFLSFFGAFCMEEYVVVVVVLLFLYVVLWINMYRWRRRRSLQKTSVRGCVLSVRF